MHGHEEGNSLEQKRSKEIDLKDIFSVIKRQLWIVITLPILFMVLGMWYSNTHKPIPLYHSSTRILVDSKNTDLSTLMVMFTDPTVLTEVNQQIGLKRSPSVIANELSITNLNSSQIIDIQVTDPNPYLAAQIANIEVSVFKDKVSKILNFNNVKQLFSANVNPSPINRGASHKYITYGFLLGLVLGIFLCFLRNSLDDSVKSEKELEHLLELPVVGSISVMTYKNSRKVISKRDRLAHFFRGSRQKRPALKTEELDENQKTHSNTAYKGLAKVHHD